eukprot:GHVP01067520.1.p1 GENE.GHVP01067520.1~~GHVP01067520.1.p1  ORF type:complete len:185 (+),score=14.83 GHVP01067520.1:56-610(+)
MSISDPRDKALCCCPIATFVKKISIFVLLNGYIYIKMAFIPISNTRGDLIMGIFCILCGILGILVVSFQLKSEAEAYYVMRAILFIDFISSFKAVSALFYLYSAIPNISPFTEILRVIARTKTYFFLGFMILSIFHFGRALWIFLVLGSFKKVADAKDVCTDLAAGNSRCRISQDGTILRTQSF